MATDYWRYYRDLYSDGKTTLRRVTEAETGKVLYYLIEYEITDPSGWRCVRTNRLYPPTTPTDIAPSEEILRPFFGASGRKSDD